MTPDHPVAEGFRSLLAEGPVLMAGAVGTEILRRGLPTPLPLWSAAALLRAPEAVADIHRRYVRAGARLVTANTFRTDRVTLACAGREETARQLSGRAIQLARRGVAAARPRRPVLIAASVAPLADCYRPGDVPDDDTLRVEHAIRAGDLIHGGATLLAVETMNTVREALAALGAARAGNVPAIVSFVCGPGGRLLSGESIADAAKAVDDLDPLAVCVNCCGLDDATVALDALRGATNRPVGVYANGRGCPDDAQGWRFTRDGPNDCAYKRAATQWLTMGAQLVGGCCGTTPKTIKRIASLFR